MVWVNSGSLWWTGRPGVLRFMGSERVGQSWATELNWRNKNKINFHQEVGVLNICNAFLRVLSELSILLNQFHKLRPQFCHYQVCLTLNYATCGYCATGVFNVEGLNARAILFMNECCKQVYFLFICISDWRSSRHFTNLFLFP